MDNNIQRLETEEDTNAELKTRQVYCFGKKEKNEEVRFEWVQRETFHVEGHVIPKTEKVRAPTV